MYIKPDTNQVFKVHSEIRSAFPNTSFPAVLTDEILLENGVLLVASTQPPEFDVRTQKLEDADPAFNAETQQWERQYTVRPLTQEEIDQEAGNVRRQRDRMLLETDWTQLDDTPLDNATKLHWAVYRQQLRSVPEQEGFPFDVTWPTKPA